MRSQRLSLPVHQPSIFSQQSFNQNRLHATQSYQIQEQMQMMNSANQIIQEICYKTNNEINQLLGINITIVEEIMRNKLIRGLKGEKMMMLTICQLVILIKENTLTLKKPEKQFELRQHYRYEQKAEMKNDSEMRMEDVMQELDSIKNSLISNDRFKVNTINTTVDRVEKKLLHMASTNKNKLDSIKMQNQKLLSQQRAIRELLEQEIEEYQKQNKLLRDRLDAREYQQSNQLEKLREEIMNLRVRQAQLINQLKEKEDIYADQILNSDILPMLLVQGLSLETVLDSR